MKLKAENFRLLTYGACQRAELELIPKKWRETPAGRHERRIHWDNILEYPPDLMPGQRDRYVFSTSADSQILVATTTFSDTPSSVTSWNIETGTRSGPKLISSFFNSGKPPKNPQYDVLGCLATRSALVCHLSEISEHQVDLAVIQRYQADGSLLSDQSESAFISIHDIQTSHCYHYLFQGLEIYKLLLYATGIVVIDVQAKVLMRIDLDTTANTHISRCWIKVSEENALQRSQTSFPFFTSDCYSQTGRLMVSNDGLTLTYVQYNDDHWSGGTSLHRWNTATGMFLPTCHPVGLHGRATTSFKGLSVDGSRLSIPTGEYIHITPGGNTVCLEGDSMPSMAISLDDRIFAYVTRDKMVIRDVQSNENLLCHPFLDEPRDILITPNRQTLVTVHHQIIRTWRIPAP